jgi:hypothetical protein
MLHLLVNSPKHEAEDSTFILNVKNEIPQDTAKHPSRFKLSAALPFFILYQY